MMIVRLLFQTVFLALGQIWANKFRALLTTLGVIIGVAAIIAITGGVRGFENFIVKQFETFGTRRVFIDGDLPRSQRGKRSWLDVQLQIPEIEAIARNCPSISTVSPIWTAGYPVDNGDTHLDGVGITGIWPTWHDVENRRVIEGRQFNSQDDKERRQVCLINEQGVKQLELPKDPVGSVILVGGRRFTVIGVVETLDNALQFGGGDVSTELFVPFATCRDILNPRGWIRMCWAQLKSPDLVEDARAEITFVLRQQRGLRGADENTFQIEFVQSALSFVNKVGTVITIGMGGLVSIALLVGGIGIMNIMLVSVSERTREIGLRKAMGAQPQVILLQFLTEAVTLCLTGAAIGVVLGFAAVGGIRLAAPKYMGGAITPLWAVMVAVGFSMLIGVVFGMFPAIKAARLDPIEALRHE
jgi:putative ABC transport system permease protein